MTLDNTSYERYQRQIILPGFGEAGQLKLLQSKVLVIGAGGLGCPALQYLAAAGVGNIGIVDDDVVSLSNLHRQPLYTTADIGLSKAEIAKQVLSRLNTGIQITAFNERLTTQNALAFMEAWDIIIDGTDNFATRYMINDACVLLGKPLVYGAVSQFEGQVAVFNYQQREGEMPVNYRDLFPQPPHAGEILNCAEAGVMGVLPGIIGTMQANEAIKLVTGIGKPLINALLTFNALNNQVFEVSLSAGQSTRLLIPAGKTEFEQTNYEWLCGAGDQPFEIDLPKFKALCNDPAVVVIDVREPGETPSPSGFEFSQLPLSDFVNGMDNIPQETIVLFCQSGKRSLRAARLLFDKFGATKNIYSLKGGILNWLNNHSTA